MGHHKDTCEKIRRGVPSLDYEAYQLRCSPYKKFEYRSHFVPAQGQGAARRGISFASFGSAKSRKSTKHQSREQSFDYQQRNIYQEQVGSDQDEAPPVEVVNTGDLLQQVGNQEEFDEGGKAVCGDVE
jgi:hypothetical protein